MQAYNLTQVIKVRTCVTMETSTLLDHVYATVFDHVNEIIVPKIGLSGHYPIGICYKRSAVKAKKFGHLSINYCDIDSLV